MPERISGLPNLARLCFHELLAPDYALPDPERALANAPGLAGIVHDLTLPTLLAAYRRGLYPLAHIAPLKGGRRRCARCFSSRTSTFRTICAG